MNTPERTTESLVREIKQGRDPEAPFQLLFERHYDQLYRFFRRKGFSPEDARDLTQEVFLSVYKGVSELRDEARFEQWLYRIVMNVYKNEIERRQAKKRAGIQVSLEDELARSDDLRPAPSPMAAATGNPMEAILEDEKREKLYEALQELPPQMRRCVHLRVVKELSHHEIAAVMRVSVNTVKAHLHQARTALKQKLNAYFSAVDL
jgi:RNA polymerase sigma-70 factor (ECF subfamily)